MTDLKSFFPWKEQAFVKLHETEISLLIELIENMHLTPYDLPADLLTRLKTSKELIQQKQTPTVFDRLDELCWEDNVPLDGNSEFSYSWHKQNDSGAAYEKLDQISGPNEKGHTKLDQISGPNEKGHTGGNHYSGIYHPNIVCEGEGICKHCGSVISYD